MRDFLNRQIVDAIKHHIKPDENLVDVVMNALSLGKEAAYRRIRGEVPFTFSETVRLSRLFRFSLDSIAGVSFPDVAVVNTRFINATQIYEDYRNTLETHHALFKLINDAERSKVSLAFNIIPFTFYSRFESLSKFKLYRWMHQMGVNSNNFTFSEMKIPDDVWRLHQDMGRQFDAFPDVCYVLDRDIFAAFVNDINHFIQLGLIKTDDSKLLKMELLALLDLFEKIVREGGSAQNNVSIYISNIDFESSYAHYEIDDTCVSSMRIFAINTVHTQDINFCETQKRWIESLKRYSVLISGCGEMERVKYIAKQREIINLL